MSATAATLALLVAYALGSAAVEAWTVWRCARRVAAVVAEYRGRA